MCIVGTGAIGGLIGVRLALAGNDVSVLARGDNRRAIEKDGLTLIEPDGSRKVARGLQASDQLAELGGQDLVVLAVKAHQLAGIAQGLPLLYEEETAVLTLQNGIPWWFFQRFPGPFQGRRIETLDPEGVLEASVPAGRVVGSIAYPAAERTMPGVIRLIEGDRFPVGELDGERTERAATIAATLSAAGFNSRTVSDLRSHIWMKACGNLAFNPISALTGATLRSICRFPATRALAKEMMSEAVVIAERLGLRLRLSVDQRIEGAERVGHHKTSMLQDLEAGRPLELEALVGSFVELGRLTETSTPATDIVYALASLLNDRLVRPRTAGEDGTSTGRKKPPGESIGTKDMDTSPAGRGIVNEPGS